MTLRPALFSMLVLLAAQATAAQTTAAQTVWRCGADGKTYSNVPCPEGRALEATEARPGADTTAAQQAAQREKALAERLAREREQKESKAGLAAAGIRSGKAASEPVKPKASEKPLKKQSRAKSKKPPADDGIWRATAPSTRQTKG
jgi:hypothetical protein